MSDNGLQLKNSSLFRQAALIGSRREESFAPVAPLLRFNTEAEVVVATNDFLELRYICMGGIDAENVA